jgi:AraC family transcriptional regulator
MQPDQRGITYQPEHKTERRRLHWCGVAVELVRVPPVAHSYQHKSTSHLLMFTERGIRADGESRADGAKVSTLRDTSGTFSIVPAGCSYDGWTMPTVPAVYLSVLIDPRAKLFDGKHGLARTCQSPLVYVPDLPVDVLSTVAKLKSALLAKTEDSTLYIQTLISLLAMELARWRNPEFLVGATRGGLAPWQVRRAKELVMAHIDGELTLDVLAGECGLSVSHFSRAFQASVGESPHRWLLERRIDRAKDLLFAKGSSLAEIALASGFRDQSHFTRTFSRSVGQSPGAWRRQNCQ